MLDARVLQEMGFPVWSRRIIAQGHDQGDARFRKHPGDVIVADDDGVVVVPALDAVRVAKVAEKRESFEAERRSKLAPGVLGLDMYRMREPLAAASLKYIDGWTARRATISSVWACRCGSITGYRL